MKNAKRIFSLLLAICMTVAMMVPAFADNSDGESYTRGSITITNPQEGETYKAYKIFDVTYELGTDGKPDGKYAYTINPIWVNDVIAYTGATADGNGVYTGKGMIITPVKNTAGTTTCYNVTLVEDDPTTTDVNEAAFSAPDFAEKMKGAIGTKTPDATFTDGVAENLDLGYYMVQPTLGALVSLTTTDKDVTITDKNEKPVPDKKLVGEDPILICTKQSTNPEGANYEEGHVHSEENGCYKEKDYTTKSVGDKVEYEVDTKVPDMTGYETYFFVINDTMSKGLTFNGDVEITLGGEKLEADKYTVKVTGGGDEETNIRIVFNDMKQWWSNDDAEDKAGEPIVITYSATVDEDAVMGTDGNTNTVYIEYSNDPNIVPEYVPQDPTDPDDPPVDPDDPKDPHYKHNQTEETTDDPTGESVKDEVTVYTAELDITKVDGKDGTTPLTGAKFKIEGEKLNVSIVNKTIFEEATDGTWYRLKDGSYTETAPANINKDPADPLETYAKIADDFVRVSYEVGEETEATVGMYFKSGDNYIEITAENKETAAAPFYDKSINIVGLYYKSGDNYVEVTEATAADHLEDDLYSKTIYKQSDLYENTSVKYKKVEVITKDNASETYTAEGFVDSDGKISFAGLAEGTYFLTELIAPDGYNLLSTPVEVVIELVATEDATNPYAFTATVNGSAVIEKDDGSLSFNIANNQGIELPETGGMGTVLFIVIGSILFGATALVLVTKKRLYNEGC